MDLSISKKKLSALLIFIPCLFLGLPAQAETFTVPQDASPQSCYVLPQDASPDECFGIPQDASPEDIERYRFSWRDLTPVKDQGHCGSCWAFGTVGAMEDKLKLGGYSDSDLSRELLVGDCGTRGNCNGGFPTEALSYLKKNGTILTKDFPYRSGTCLYKFLGHSLCGNSCQCLALGIPNLNSFYCTATCSDMCPNMNTMDNIFKISDWAGLTYDSALVKDALLSKGPLVANLNIHHTVELIGFDDCSRICHVAYGTWGCWIIKNSWGVFSGFSHGIYHINGYGYIPYCNNTRTCTHFKDCPIITGIYYLGDILN